MGSPGGTFPGGFSQVSDITSIPVFVCQTSIHYGKQRKTACIVSVNNYSYGYTRV